MSYESFSAYPHDAGEDGFRFDETAFVERYGHVEVTFGPLTVPLTEALAAESMFCPADEEQRTSDQRARAAFLAERVHVTGRLMAEDYRLLPPESDTEA